MQAFLQYQENIAVVLGILAAAAAVALIAHYLLFKILRLISKNFVGVVLEDSLCKHCRRPLCWIIIVVAIRLVLPVFDISDKLADTLGHIISLFLIGLVSWWLIKAIYVLEDYVLSRFDVDAKDNLRARKVYTQLKVLKQIVIIVVSILALGTMLMTFPGVQQLGTTILASAGIIGIVVGMAAQRTIGTFIAGLQIAFTQPIRLDDVVIVENEWGRVEEIALTYVVVKIWDLRRLVVPITYFIEKPFQNWTRSTSDLLVTAYLYVDYTVPIEAVRQELRRILENSALWDGKVCGLQVTNTSERTIELRALMSAADASKGWDLRCEVREKLVTFIQKKYPNALPKLRGELEKPKG